MRSAHFEVCASRVIDRRNLPLTWSLQDIVMNEVDARHLPIPHSSLVPMGKVSASFFGQQDAVYVTLITLHVHFPTATFSTHSHTKILIYCSIFHVYFAHLETSYVDRGKHFLIKWYVMRLKNYSPTPVTCSEAIL